MDIKISEEIVRTFFEKMDCLVSAEVSLKDGVLNIGLKSEEARILIGQNGQTLADLQHLLAKIIKKALKEEIFLNLDIEDYKKRKIDYLKDIARTAADEVASSKREKLMPPLSAFDRRIVHMELANRTDIKTESVGENPERRIVVRPV
ncbi:MAG: R3H domain-containing nucleic acid-binding protein [Candidatus Paceibacterota bacterium]|jgi:spoIIIJ-associated protein